MIAILIPLALTGVLGLAAVVAVHELAEIVVIANGGVRAGRTKPLDSVAAAELARLSWSGGAGFLSQVLCCWVSAGCVRVGGVYAANCAVVPRLSMALR